MISVVVDLGYPVFVGPDWWDFFGIPSPLRSEGIGRDNGEVEGGCWRPILGSNCQFGAFGNEKSSLNASIEAKRCEKPCVSCHYVFIFVLASLLAECHESFGWFLVPFSWNPSMVSTSRSAGPYSPWHRNHGVAGQSWWCDSHLGR